MNQEQEKLSKSKQKLQDRLSKPKIGFGGSIDGHTTKLQRDFQKAHLNAYLKGWDFFRFRYTRDEIVNRIPAWFEVDRKLIK